MKKAPTTLQASGALGEQLSLNTTPPFCPTSPPRGSAAEQALTDQLARDLTQIEWLKEGKGWRIAAAVKGLGFLGREPVSTRVMCSGWRRKIASYSLPQKAKQAAAVLMGGGAHA